MKLSIVVFTLGALLLTISILPAYANEVEVEDDEETGSGAGDAGIDAAAAAAYLKKLADEGAEEEDAILELEAHPDISTYYIFPENPAQRFPYGQRAELLFGLENKGQYEFNVTYVQAHLVVPQDFNYYMENYTAAAVDTVVVPGEVASGLYFFTPHEALDARQYGLTVYVYYEDVDGAPWRSVVYNSTFEIVEPSDFVDPTTFFTILAIVAVAALVGYLALRNRSTKSGSKGSGSASSSGKSGWTENSRSFLSGTNAFGSPSNKRKTKGN